MLRKLYREILKKITLKVIEKHKPNIIAVAGDGQTSIARELTYEVVNAHFPARRNLESPEAEFSVPLTIIGYNKYPSSYLEWVWVLIKSLINLKTVKSYSHFLVLELNFIEEELMREWLEITQPETFLIVGKLPLDYSEYKFKKIVKLSSNGSENVLGPFKIAVRQIARYYEIPDEKLEEVFESFTLPTSKIRYFPGLHDSIILDATHYYFPIKLEAVLEMVDEQEDNIILFSKLPQDEPLVKNNMKLNPANYTPQKDDLIILRGEKSKILPMYENLFAKNSPLI